jgi:glycosyltransferase involved in cell wall biosynthesis
MAGKRIVLLTGAPLATNPRVQKEAETLAQAGCDVEILGAWLSDLTMREDQELARGRKWRFTPVLDAWKRNLFLPRLRRRLAQEIHARLSRESPLQLSPAVPSLWRAARTRQADLFIAHSEPGLWVADQLRRRGARVGVDMEDWWSEDLLPEARRHRPLRLLCRLERDVLRHAAHRTCPSEAMAGTLAKEYGCPSPVVVYNAFPWTERATLDGKLVDRKSRAVPSIHWYSQTIGPGRGLEELLAALAKVNAPFELHVRGAMAQGAEDWWRGLVPQPLQPRVFVHPPVSNRELLSRIAEHDIGFAGELSYCRNKIHTVSNKILQYMLAGLAVVASDTAGQCEVARSAGDAISLYQGGDVAQLTGELQQLLSRREQLRAAKAAALYASEAHFNWEKEATKLVNSVRQAL